MPQEFAHEHKQEALGAEEGAQVTSTEYTDSQIGSQIDALDAVLDDIESALENNAQEYVNSFVQKGGQ